MDKIPIGVKIIIFVAIFIAIMFILESFGLEWTKYFGVKRENVRREIFEETQSYNHGKQQALAKYYKEYYDSETSTDNKRNIESVIVMEFASFDTEKLNNEELKKFLKKVRGY